MATTTRVLFVCLHGSAKSLIALEHSSAGPGLAYMGSNFFIARDHDRAIVALDPEATLISRSRLYGVAA